MASQHEWYKRILAWVKPWKEMNDIVQQKISILVALVVTHSLATPQSITWNWVLISPWICRGIHPQIKLLAQILMNPILRPHIPHPHIVQRHVKCSPWLGINLSNQIILFNIIVLMSMKWPFHESYKSCLPY